MRTKSDGPRLLNPVVAGGMLYDDIRTMPPAKISRETLIQWSDRLAEIVANFEVNRKSAQGEVE